MFLSTVIPSSKLNINAKNVDPYQFTVPYNFVRGRTISIDFSPVKAISSGNAGQNHQLVRNIQGTLNSLIITIPTDVTTHVANKDIIMTGSFGGQTQTWKYNINITCNTVDNTITFTPISYTHIEGTTYRNYIDDEYTYAVLLNIHTKL